MNPYVSGRLPNTTITRVVASAGSREAERLFFTALNSWTLGTTSEYNITKDSSGVALPFMSNPWIIGQENILYVGSEAKIQAAVTNLPGSIGIVIVTNQLEDSTMKARVLKPTGEVVTDSATAAYRCQADTFNLTTFRFKSSLSNEPGCWPFTTFVYTMVRTANVDDQCINAPRALAFLQFLHDRKLQLEIHIHSINSIGL